MTRRLDPATLRRLQREDVVILSMGAGVQSSAMALMATQGVFDKVPDAAVFSDTQWEPKKIYEWLATLEPLLSFPVYHVTRGSLRNGVFRNENATGQRFASIPWFTKEVLPDGTVKQGMGRRQCTREYKIDPVRKKTRELMGYKQGRRIKKHAAEMWIGISTDEAARAKPSLDIWQTNRWPLLEKGFSRQDCKDWVAAHYPNLGEPPKSACIGCPFHSDDHWIDMRDNDPESWAEAVAADRAIRQQPKFNAQQFAHRARVPLDEVVLKPRANKDNFVNECEGMCGV